MHDARNLELFFIFQELKKLEVENSWLMSIMPQPPDTEYVCSVTGVHFPPGSFTPWDVLDTPPYIDLIYMRYIEEQLLEFRRQSVQHNREKLFSDSLMTFH